jgi:hypothetical protein
MRETKIRTHLTGEGHICQSERGRVINFCKMGKEYKFSKGGEQGCAFSGGEGSNSFQGGVQIFQRMHAEIMKREG